MYNRNLAQILPKIAERSGYENRPWLHVKALRQFKLPPRIFMFHYLLSTGIAIVNKNPLTLYRMVMPIGTPFLKEKINN